MIVKIRYVGDGTVSVWDRKRLIRVLFVNGWTIGVSRQLADELLKNNPAHWVEVKEEYGNSIWNKRLDGIR